MAFSDPIKYFGNFGHSANCYFMLYKQSIHHQFVCLSGGEKKQAEGGGKGLWQNKGKGKKLLLLMYQLFEKRRRKTFFPLLVQCCKGC